jgi:hypothetical protein
VVSSRPAVLDHIDRGSSGKRKPVVVQTRTDAHPAPAMAHATAGPPMKQWAQVAIATLLVAVCPVAIVWWLRASDVVSSPVIGVVLGMALSLGASQIGRVVWEKRPGSEDLLFSELMLWGYLHRWHSQRRLASARELLGRMSAAQRDALDGLSIKQQAKLLEQLVAGVETRDPYLHGHSRRVARHSWMIARRMGLPREEVARIRTAAAVHDVGKIETPKAILHKRGPLSAEEYEVIKCHPDDGARMAAVLRDAELTSIVRHHHERLDGTGYPSALSGEDIPLGARIVAVADTFDAITSARPYRLASPHKKAIDILKAEAGTKLDPAVVRAFCGHYAGRRPMALWASVTGLPERLLSWLASSAGSVASAAKMVAVAALVGGTAATTSALAVPSSTHRAATIHSTSTLSVHAQRVSATSVSAHAVAPSRHARQAERKAASSTSAGAVALTPRQAPAGGVAALSAHPTASETPRGGSAQGVSPATGELRVVKGQTEKNPGTNEEAGKVTAKETTGRSGEAPGKTKTEAAPGKSGEAPGHTKSEASPGKSAEAPGHNKPEESPGNSAEAPGHNKPEESPGNSAEAPGHNKTEESPGNSAEAPGHNKTEETPGKSGEAHGKG